MIIILFKNTENKKRAQYGIWESSKYNEVRMSMFLKYYAICFKEKTFYWCHVQLKILIII